MKGRMQFIKDVLMREIEVLENENGSFARVEAWADDDQCRWFAHKYLLDFVIPQFEKMEDLIHEGVSKYYLDRGNIEEEISDQMDFPCL